MAGLFADLNGAGKLALGAVGRRIRSEIEPPPDLEQFASSLEKVLSNAPASAIRDYYWVDLPANQPPWKAAGLQQDASQYP